MSDDKMGVTELAILMDISLMMAVYSLAKVFSNAETDVLFEAIGEKLKSQGFDPKNLIIEKVKESVNLIHDGLAKEKV